MNDAPTDIQMLIDTSVNHIGETITQAQEVFKLEPGLVLNELYKLKLARDRLEQLILNVLEYEDYQRLRAEEHAYNNQFN